MERFRVLPGLPATGSWPEQFSVTGHGTHSEGFVVEFLPEGKPSWVGNFQPGYTSYFGVLPHPDGTSLLVISGGHLYVVDPDKRSLLAAFNGAIDTALVIQDGKLVVMGNAIRLEAWDSGGLRWCSRRISWDGIWDLRAENNALTGKSWSAIDEIEYPFSVDLRTGSVEGGSYNGPPE